MNNLKPWHRTIRKNTRPTDPINMDRIERWLGADKMLHLQRSMRGWYGAPINVRDLPGSVWITKDGDFIGKFGRGGFASAYDAFEDHLRRSWRELSKPQYGIAHAGFTSISDALARASSGNSQNLNGTISKAGPTKVVGSASSLWRVGTQPIAGAAGAAAPGGTAHVKSNTGAMAFNNPSSGTLHLVGADFSASIINNAVMLYDRLFSVAKTIASVANESVTGVPTRYQSSTATTEDYAGGNFLFMEVGATAYANTAHNWGVAGGSNECLYRNQAGTDNSILPVLAGNPGGVATIADRFDMPVNTWFAPLASGDTGIMDLAQMRCSASVATGALNFVIGHPIGIMAFPVINSLLPFDWLTNRNQAPRIFDNACLAMFELPAPATTATTYTGMIYATSAAP
ncbi:MAG: hypothetical protein IPO08_25125 [Xanthomonadales bacterium]|nr:hypothetical protein [Xanthomonadales bacterium]